MTATCYVLLFLLLPYTTWQQCQSQPYPKVVGGLYSDTYLYQLDYHEASSRIVAVGGTRDWNIKTNSDTSMPSMRAMIISYLASEGHIIKWAKYLEGTEMTFVSVRFEPVQGEYVLVLGSDNSFFIFRAVDGVIYHFLRNSQLTKTTNVVDQLTRNILLVSGSANSLSIYGNACNTFDVVTSTCTQYRLIKYTVYSQNVGENVWQRIYDPMVKQTFHMECDQNTSTIFQAIKQNDNMMRIIEIQESDGFVVNAFGYDTINIESAMFQVKQISDMRIMYTVAYENSVGITLFKNILQDSTIGFLLSLSQPLLAGGNYQLRAIKVFTNNIVIIIIFEESTKQNFIISAALSNTDPTYKLKKVFPRNYEYVGLGFIIDYNNALIPANKANVPMSLDESDQVFTKVSDFVQGMILHSRQLLSCITNTGISTNPEQYLGNLIPYNSFLKQQVTTYFDMHTTDVLYQFEIVPQVNYVSINLDGLTNNNNWCQLYGWNYIETYQFPYGANYNVTVPQFKATCESITDGQPIEYSLYQMFMAHQPTFIEFEEGQIIIDPVTSELGINYLVVRGDYNSNLNAVFALIRLEGILPNPPAFNTSFPDLLAIHQWTNYSFQVPSYYDPQNLEVSVLVNPNTAADFTTYDHTTNQITFTPSTIGYYVIQFQLFNGFAYAYEEFLLKVINDPPYFSNGVISPFPDLRIPLNHEIDYQLPQYQDDEGEDIKLSHSSEIPSFVNFNEDGNIYSIRPNLPNQIGRHQIKGEICDVVNQCRVFQFCIVVTNSPPFMLGKLNNQIVRVGETLEYKLPQIQDLEDQDFSITTSLLGGIPLPNFINFQSSTQTFYITPTKEEQVLTYDIEIQLSDKISEPNVYKFLLIILSTSTSSYSNNNKSEQADLPQVSTTNQDYKNITDELAQISNSTNTTQISSVINQLLQYQQYFNQVQLQIFKNAILKLHENDKSFFIFKATFQASSANRFQQIKVQIKADQHANDIAITIQESYLNITLIKTDQENRIPIQHFNITERSNQIIIIKLKIPEGISVSERNVSINVDFNLLQDLDLIEISLNQEVLRVGQNYMISMKPEQRSIIEIPQQLSEREAKLAKNIQMVSDVATKAALPIGFALNLSLSACIQYLWGFLNDLSFLTIQSMIGIQLPGISQVIQAAFLNFIYLDVLMTDKWLIPIIFPEENGGDDQPLNSQFDDNGFSSMILIKNLGSTFIYLIALICGYALMGISTFFQRTKNLHLWLKQHLIWNTGIRFALQQFPPIIIASIINIQSINFQTFGEALSSILSIIFMGSSIMTILALTRVQYKNDKNTEEYKKKYSNLTESLNCQNRTGRYWNIIVLVRWQLTTFVLVSFKDYPCFQLQLMLLTSLFCQCIILSGQPFLNVTDNRLTLINEIITSLYLYLMMCETEYNSTNPFRQEIGQVIVYLVLFSVFINFSKFAKGVIVEINKVYIKKCQRRNIRVPKEPSKQRKELQGNATNNNTNKLQESSDVMIEINENYQFQKEKKKRTRNKRIRKQQKQKTHQQDQSQEQMIDTFGNQFRQVTKEIQWNNNDEDSVVKFISSNLKRPKIKQQINLQEPRIQEQHSQKQQLIITPAEQQYVNIAPSIGLICNRIPNQQEENNMRQKQIEQIIKERVEIEIQKKQYLEIKGLPWPFIQ